MQLGIFLNPKSNHVSPAQNLWDAFPAGQMAKETLLLWTQLLSDLSPTEPRGLTQLQPSASCLEHASRFTPQGFGPPMPSAWKVLPICVIHRSPQGAQCPCWKRLPDCWHPSFPPPHSTFPLSPQSPAPSNIPCHIRCLFCLSSCGNIEPTGRGTELSFLLTVSVSHSVVSNSL